MSKYEVKPNGSEPAFEVEADKAEFDPQTGRTNFYTGEGDDKELVASYLNVSFCKLPAA